MKIASLTITEKLLIFILPLVCIPIIVVGYLSYDASVERVTRLSKEEQLLKAKAAASKINEVFQTANLDLQTISQWKSISKYYQALSANDPIDIRKYREDIEDIFELFINRSTFYNYISLFHTSGKGNLSVSKASAGWNGLPGLNKFLKEMTENSSSDTRISKIYYSTIQKKYVVYVGNTIKDQDNKPKGILFIELDFSKIIHLILDIKVGERGFAFLVDQWGRTIAHPEYKPYEYNFTRYNDPRLREFIIDMISGETGWKTYYHFNEMAAAFAPVKAAKWSLAVNVPIEEFKYEAKSLRSIVIQFVLIFLLISVIILSFLSYQIVKPIKTLVIASEEVAKGDLLQEIPIPSGGEMETLTRSFNSMIRSLRNTQAELLRSERLISIGKLSAGVAHEIRNPLNAMKGAITYIKKHEGDSPIIRDFTQLILEEINRLSQFVNEFLQFAKLSNPKRALSDVNELIENTINLFTENFKEKNIHIVKELDDHLPPCRIDIKQIEQVLVNIFVNASDAVSDNGEITIRSTMEETSREEFPEPFLVIKVYDNGSGIPEEHMKNIFDPFYSTKEDGTGLGLPISLNIIENHGGHFTISSQINQGTEITIRLPVADDPEYNGANYEKEDFNR